MCFNKIWRENLQSIHDSFWNIGDYYLEQQQLYKLLQCKEVKSEHSNKQIRFDHHVIVNYKPINICRKAFLSILDIDESRVDTLRKRIKADGTLEGDQRGKKGSHNAIDPKLIDAVHDHIQTLNVCSSHYDIEGKVGSKQFIVHHDDYDSMNKVYIRYTEYCDSNKIEAVKRYKYFQIFNKHYNISIMKT